ncbi:hypothetical protein Tco_0638448 [Tanacetum coccineum]
MQLPTIDLKWKNIVIKLSERYKMHFTSDKEIEVIREDSNTYVFSEADYESLHLNDIEDLYLMKIQIKLEHLTISIMDSLLIFIRRAVIKFRVEELQLGLESYQKRLNIRRPRLTFPRIDEEEPYTLMLNDHKLRYKKGYIANRIWTTVEEINYGEIKMACELKLKFKEQMRRMENYFGGRSRIPDIMQFSRPE